jgi:siroheme synthase
VDFEVVPGVSSGLAAPASAGIPVTHRGIASAVTFVSGHGPDGNAPDWEGLSRTGGTLVIFMGVKGLPQIVAGLVAAGVPRDMPVAAIERATWPDHRVLRAELSGIAEAAIREGLRSPAILVVGRTVGLADRIGAGSVGDCVEALTHAA